jgi:hypothetical protein
MKPAKKILWTVLWAAGLSLVPAGCAKNPFGPLFAGGAGVLTASPMDFANVAYIIALGNLNPPAHTFPTDHTYFYHNNPAGAFPVYAPADGYVSRIQAGQDYRVTIQLTADFYCYLGHIIPENLSVGEIVHSGQRIGHSSSYALAVDLGVSNRDIPAAGFINPARYDDETLHSDSPFKYFQDPLKSQVYSRVFRNGPDKDGKFDYDQPGKLVGNWFLDGLAVSDSDNPNAWPEQMSFAYDVVNPTQVEIGIGGTVGVVGSFAVQSGAPDPATVTPANGQVNYQLYGTTGYNNPPSPTQTGLLAVQMVRDDRMEMEFSPCNPCTTLTFDGNAKYYVR